MHSMGVGMSLVDLNQVCGARAGQQVALAQLRDTALIMQKYASPPHASNAS